MGEPHPRAAELAAWLAGTERPPVLRDIPRLRWSVIPGGAVNLRVRVSGRVDTATRSWFLRFAGRGSAALGARLEAEALAHGAAAAADLAPALIHADPARGILMSEWWPSRPWTWRGARRDLATFGHWAARLHALRAPPGLPPLDALAAARQLVDKVLRKNSPALRALGRSMDRVLQELSPTLPLLAASPALIHADLHAANLLLGRDGTLRAVDFEYAGAGQPCHDLAVFASCHDLAKLHRRELLGAYAVAGGLAPGLDEFDDWCRLADVIWLAWTVLVHGEGWHDAPRAERVARRLTAVS